MNVTTTTGTVITGVKMELTLEEASALRHTLGTDSKGNRLCRGVSNDESEIVYQFFCKLATALDTP